MKITTIRVEPELWAEFDKVAKAQDRDRSYLIRKFMREQVSQLQAA